jgi:hypothetical protein
MHYKKSSDSSVGYTKAISSRDGIQRKNGKLIRISCIDAYKSDVASIDSHTVFFSGGEKCLCLVEVSWIASPLRSDNDQ